MKTVASTLGVARSNLIERHDKVCGMCCARTCNITTALGHISALTKDSPLTRSVQAIGSILSLPVLGDCTIITSGSNFRHGQQDSRALHDRRSSAHMPGPLIPIAGKNHFDILEELRKPDGILTRAVITLTAGR